MSIQVRIFSPPMILFCYCSAEANKKLHELQPEIRRLAGLNQQEYVHLGYQKIVDGNIVTIWLNSQMFLRDVYDLYEQVSSFSLPTFSKIQCLLFVSSEILITELLP